MIGPLTPAQMAAIDNLIARAHRRGRVMSLHWTPSFELVMHIDRHEFDSLEAATAYVTAIEGTRAAKRH